MKSGATSVKAYLAELPADRRAAIEAVRRTMVAAMPKGYVETMGFGMINWVVPPAVRPATYNGQPLLYAALASQKQHMAVYLMCGYASPGAKTKLRDAFAKAGKKLDMGGSCVRFRSLDQLHLPAIAEAVASSPMDRFVAACDAVFAGRKLKPVAGAPAVAKAKAPAKAKGTAKAKPAAKRVAKATPAAKAKTSARRAARR